MIDISSCKKRLVASILCANTIFLTMPVNGFASEITGITPNGNTYNIEAAKVSGNTGFRHYDKFTLSQGDIANLKFKYNYSKFVNLVNSQININGIVNTMKGNSFYNGHAIFVSPNGMVVGASGLLNVGSLSVLTPTQGKYNDFLDAYEVGALSSYEHGATKYKELITDSKGDIVINGKILAREEVNLHGGNITIGDGTNRAGIIAGWKDTDTAFSDSDAAESAFNSLVSNNITNADSFALENGKIQIVANKESGFGDAGGNITAKVDIKNSDLGANEIDISSSAKVDRQERIDLATAKVNVENSNITGDTVSITAEATQKKSLNTESIIDDGQWIANAIMDLFESDTPSIGSLWGVAGKAEADVTIKNSTIKALGATESTDENPDSSVYIHSEASSETEENANFLTPTLIDFIKSDEAKIDEYFSLEIYNGFEGARSSATVNIENSVIDATADKAKNVEISTEASSSLDANNGLLAIFLPIGMYGLGTETVSKATVKGSTLSVTHGDIDVTAVSSNENSISITNDSLFSIKLEDGFLAMILNNNVKTETEAAIIDSTVSTNNLSVFATNFAESSADVSMEAIAGEKDANDQEAHGNSAVSGVAIMNHSSNSVTALIKDSEINTEEDTLVLAQSLNITENAADGSIDDKMVKKPEVFDANVQNFLKDKQKKYFNVNIFERLRGQNIITAGEDENPFAEVGGAVVLNNTNNLTTAKIENSTVTAGDVTVQANTVDLLSNAATTDTQGEGKYGLSASVVYNQQNNTTNAIIDKSEVEADNVTVDATTELPMNVGKLTFGLKLPFKIKGMDSFYVGGKFASEANGKWSAELDTPKADDSAPAFEISGLAEQNIRSSYNDLKPKFRLSGFFNNMAQSNSVGANAAASGSVIYNEVNTNTTAIIQNESSITINPAEGGAEEGKLTVNAVNSVIGYNGLGLFDILIKKINYKIPGQYDWEYEPTVSGGKFGLGANFAWDAYTNNATAKIDNSSVDAQKGSISIDSATEQSYMNVIMTGGVSETLGIDGSIHVQKIKGNTIAAISNITGDNSVNAKDISVNAGKAHIKTTAGKIERDDDTNQVKWKEQDSTAQGDAKYIREAKDEITNIIAQGAWTSQIEEIDNTVQENSAGVAVGASVNITDIDRTVKATIDNAIAEATNNLTVNSDTYNQKIDVEVAAAFSGSVKQKEVNNVQQNADNAQEDEDNIFGNLFDNEDEYMRNPVGNDLAALQSQFSMSIAGAVDITTDSTKAESSIINSEVSAGNTLTVNSNREAFNIVFGGTIGKSKKVGAGAAVNVYKQEGSVKSYIDGSTITFSGDTPALDMDANNKNWILDIAIGAGAAVNTAAEGKGFQAAVGGSASTNTIKPTIEAYINNSTISMEEGKSGNINVDIDAKSEVDIINVAGGGSLAFGAQNGVSAGAALNYNNIKNTISTYIKDSTLEDIGTLTITADADNDLSDWAIAGAIVAGTDGGAFSFAGGVNIDYIHDTISSKVMNSTITANDDIEIKANSNSDNLDVAGTFDITTAQSGVGVNGNVVVEVFRNNITAEIDKDSKILKAKDIKVSATSVEKANVIPVGVSVATNNQYLMAAANVGVNIVDNTVKAYLSGKVGTGDDEDEADNVNSISVAAYDETTLYSRGGTVAIASADSAINIAGSVNVDKIDKTVEAKIKDANIKANGDVTVLANSINSLGGTKNEEGEYTREDVTTDAYKEKMLKKDSNGDYDDLKLGNDFKNWNMFYDLAVGSSVSVGGAGIGKVIENTVTAEINNSEIEANNLNVLAKDYSVKNIIAGSVSASSKAAAGLQAIYTRDNSTTSAFITNGSKLTITDTVEMLANNQKDSYEILVAGSGAGKGVINANVVLNNVTDKAAAKIDNTSTDNEIKAGTLNISANEDINSSHIIVTAGGAQSVALSVSPTINDYNMTTEAIINNANIQNAVIDMDAQSKIDSLDIAVGIAGVGQGLAGVGNAIKNVYANKVNSYIDNSIINTPNNITIDSNSIIDSNNWLGSVCVAGQGADLIVNLILNNVDSQVEAGIKNTDIQKAGSITINANKDKKDELDNHAGILGVVGQGVSASVNLIKNAYTNTVKSYVDNTSSTEIGSLSVNSYSDRWLDNMNVGIGFSGEGASLLANAIDNEFNSTTYSYIDAKSKTLNITNALALEAKDTAAASNMIAMVNGAGLAGALGANINLFYADNLAKTEIKSASDGKINAGSLSMYSELTNAYDTTDFNLSFGLAAIPVDIQLIELGKRTGTYSDAEQKSKIGDFVNKAKGMEPDELKYTPTTPASNIKTGAISTVNGNIKTENDTNINAKSQLKGIGNDGALVDKLKLTNIKVSASGGGINIAIRDVQNSSNTLAEIAGGKVESTSGNVGLNAESSSDVEIINTEVNVAVVHATGGSALYNNSSETTAQIKDATVSANDIDIISKSSSKSNIDATHVIAAGAGIVTVDLAEANDTNKSSALITSSENGTTKIDASGKITLHSTATTDLRAVKDSYPIQLVNIVNVSRNKAEANTIARAIIENVNGEINANNLDIITDYDNMNVYSKANVVAVGIADLASYTDTGSFMKADFKSGIDSPTSLVLNVADTTNIVTARDNRTESDAVGMVSKSEAPSVSVSVAGLYTGSFAKAENNATSATVLNVKEHKSNNLNINQYLKTSAISSGDSTKVTGLGVSAIAADSKDTSTMNFDIAGNNTIVQNAVINATHDSKISSSLDGFSFGLLVNGARLRIDSELTSNTTGNIGGEFNANSANVNVNTTRESVMSRSSGSGGIINVSNPEASNKLTGSSVLNIKNIKSDSNEGINNWSISNKSANTFNVTTSNGSGGIINVAVDKSNLTFDTSTNTNIENADINSTGLVKFEVENKGIIKDEATGTGGGFVAVSTNDVKNEYKSGAKLTIKDTTMNVKNLDLKTTSDLRTKNDDYVKYAGTAAGFVAVEDLDIKNTLTQTSEINIQNSILEATKDAKIEALTSSSFKQKIDSHGYGFVAVPRGYNTLEVINTNKISVDNQSKIKANDELDISFNSNNNLGVRTVSILKNFEGKPSAYATLNFTVNNTLDNSGSLEAGNLVDINFMNNSINTLDQYAHSECYAWIASTNEGGELKRTINNTLNVNSNADITSGKDIEISYSAGKTNASSLISWYTESWPLGFPIGDSGTSKNDKPVNNYGLKDDGKIVAGQGNSKYMKINRDGTIDKDSLKGFYDDDYSLADGEVISGETIKQRTLDSITIEINNAGESLTEVNQTITDMQGAIDDIEDKKAPVQAQLDEINDMIADGYILKNDNAAEGQTSEFNTIIQNDIKALLISDSESDKITEAQYNTMMNDYADELANIQAQNQAIFNENAKPENIDNQQPYLEAPTMLEFLDTQDYGFTDEQKTTITNGYNQVNNNISLAANTKFTTYQNASGKYVGVSNPTGAGTSQTCDEITQFKNELENFDNQIKPYEDKLASNEEAKTLLEANIASLEAEYTKVSNTPAIQYEQQQGNYSVVFNDISPKGAHIIVDGAYNHNITGSGTFSVASSGLKIDNYSTRSLIFRDINVNSPISNSGLIIGGKEHGVFADKQQAVSGMDAYMYIHNIIGHNSFENLPTSGVHYKNGGSDISGITINNYYDINHPFASTFEIPFSTSESNISFTGNIYTSNNFNVWNESGNIIFVTDVIDAGTMNLYSTNGQIEAIMHNSTNNTKFTLNSDGNIFAAEGLFINADNVDIKGNVKTGYSNRSITITDEMLNEENLLVDATSGEKNLINLGGNTISPYLNDGTTNGNIKAIYKDGQIYLYHLPEIAQKNGVEIKKVNGENASGSVTGTITVADGYQNITIDNQTNKQLNIANITNAYFEGKVSANNIDISNANITKNTKDFAQTNITSTGKLSLNGIINNNVRKGVDTYMVQNTNGKLNITAENGLDLIQQKQEDNVVDSIFAGGLVDITVNNGEVNIAGNITDKGEIKIYNFGDDKIDINGDITDIEGNISIENNGAGKLTINGEILDKKGDITILGTGTGETKLTNSITAEIGGIFIASKGLTASLDSAILSKKGDVDITNNAGALNLYGSISDWEGNVSIQNNGTSALVSGLITDEKGDLTIINTNGDMTISSEIYHNYLSQDSEGMISIINNPEAGKLNIQAPIQTWGIGRTETDTQTGEDVTTAILIDNRSTTNGMTISSAVSARIGDIIIKNAADSLSVDAMISNTENGNIKITNNGENSTIKGSVIAQTGDIIISNSKGYLTVQSDISDNVKGNINISNAGEGNTLIEESIFANEGDISISNNKGKLTLNSIITDNKGNIEITSNAQTEFKGEILANEGNISISSVGLDAAENSIITDNKGDITIQNIPYYNSETETSTYGSMNLLGDIRDFDGSIDIESYYDAVVGGYITDEKGRVGIRSYGGEMTVSADINMNYLNPESDGSISISSLSFGKNLNITGNIINWGAGHTGMSGTTGISITNSASTSEGITISGSLSARVGDIDILNEYGKLTTTADATISNTENGAIIMTNAGKEGSEIRGSIIATEGNIDITNIKKDLLINAEIAEKKGNINITNSGKNLTYLGDTLNEFGDTKVINNGTGIVQVGASIDNTGNVTIRNINGENLIFDGEINNYGNTWITNNEGLVHIYGDITNEHGSTIIQNEGSFTEITSVINNDTGSIGISNRNGHLRITDTAEINNTSNRENSNITIVNYGEDTSEPSNLIIAGNINSYNKGYVEIINNGDEANLSGDIFANDGNIGITNSNDGKLTMSGNIVDYHGDVSINNNSDDGAEIGGTILDEQGDIEIRNNGGDLKVTSEITHNYLNRDAQGMISIINTSGAGKVEIDAALITDGAGKTDDNGNTTAILVDNSSAYGMSIKDTVSARIGDIIIKNASEDLLTSGMISVYEQGSVNITNGTEDLANAGNDLTNTANIMVKSGDVNITNNGVGKAQIGGSVTNENGNTTIVNKGTNLVYSGTIDNTGGNTSISNSDGVAYIYGDITNKGGDINITNTGSFTEITKSISNEAGSIHISNSNGHLNITDTAQITNKTDNTNDSITIANGGDNLNITGIVESLNKGDIEITNTGSGKANIAGNITANEGDIDITNSNDGELNISGNVVDYNGNIDVTNDSQDGMTVASTGKITNVKGNTTITNNKGNLTVQNGGQIINTESGNIKAENKGGKFTIAGLFKHSEIGNITINNSGNEELDITSAGKVLAANGDINIQNSNDGALSIAGTVTNDNGKIDVINSSKDGALISGTILDKGGNTAIYNAGGDLTVSGNVVDRYGNIGITNTSNGTLTLSGTTLANDGNITVYSTNGTVNISGYVVDDKGELKVINNGQGGTSISGTVLDKEGDLTVYNTEGELNISGNVVDNKGKLSISNTSNDDLTTISGTINAKDGDANVYTNGGLSVTNTAYIVDDKGNLNITNKGGEGAEIKGTVLAKEGDATIYNDAGKLDIIGNIVDNKGDLKVINHGEDGASISGIVLAKEGDTLVYNTQGALDISGNVADNKGQLDITNTGEGGAVISGIVLAKDGDANIHNENGDFTISGTVKDESGNINISNDGGTADISGTVLAQNGNIDVTNANDGALNISGTIKDENGKINITNDSNDGTNISGNVTNIKDDTTITNNAGDLEITQSAKITNTESGNIKAENKGGKFSLAGLLKHFGIGNIDVENSGDGELEVATTGVVQATQGDIDISNSNDGALNIAGFVGSDKGVTTVDNTSKDGINIATTGTINNKDGNIEISNTGAAGISVSGIIKTDKKDIKINNNDSDLRIGEYDSDNDNYINAKSGNIVINQTNGNILNNITDPDTTKKHQNSDLGNPDHSYKTLIAASNNLTINAKDGDIGSTSHDNPGFSINADTRDYTESINVNVGGNLVARATNENKTDNRLVNIRAKDSDLKVKDVTSDGNVMLTAADWKQADKRPTPKKDESYFKGYSILNTASGDDAPVTGQMISVIASDNIGSENKKFIYNQDTASNPKSSVSFEAENDIYLTGRANSSNETKIYQLVSKHGDIEFDMESDAVIKEITAGKGLRLTQKAQNLTIYNLGTSYSSAGQSGEKFDDILYPHDGIVYGGSSEESGESAIPNYVIIRVLDAMENPNRGDSNLKIYSAYVRGNHGENTQYYPDGSRLADYTLMADNIYANSDKAPDSTVSTKANPNGYKQKDKSYDLSEFGVDDGKTYPAKGLNAYGKGDTLSLDILGVDSDVVNEVVKNPQRNSYNEQKSVDNTPDKFKNDQNRLPFYDYDFRADNAVISVNDYAPENRGVSFDTLYANNAYINTHDTKLGVQDGYVNNYAELRNRDKIAVVDNDFRRIVKPADIQLYTQKTGSFALDLNETINMRTTAPTVYNNPHMLVNGYHSAWNFVNREFKESKDLIERIDESEALEKKYNEEDKRISMRFDTTNDTGLSSNVEIYDISTTGALIRNDKKLKRGKKTTINLKFEDVNINVQVKVVNLEGNKAGVEFIDMPREVANKILYRYMKQAGSMKPNLTSSL